MDTGAVPDADATTAGPETADERSQVPRPRHHTSRAPHFVKRSRTLHLTWQIGVAIVGFAVIAAGMAMMVLPGPGIPALLVGLAILGTEFVWAQRTLLWTKDQAAKAAQRALDPRTRRRNMIILTAGCVLIAATAGGYLLTFGLVLPWQVW
ncbi:TIGR02611 family protein [Yinghuangia seranimata]|uniref:TIGR02611 family protein n=1 Tax=Yinghuangia seranimata TaxID=408067 RepID=UPI00248AB5AF|nr:TIGR02611 family protein [Yinghuangia seranimata]MDI2132687.1 TIGR02611 family protein [Yinghuangia seranimata]